MNINIINNTQRVNNSEENDVNENEDNYIYCLIEREFLKSGEPIYKIGKSKQILRRFSNYPKGSKMVFFSKVVDCNLAENDLKNILKSHECIKNIPEIGTEYFLADIKDLLKVLFDVCLLHNNIK